MATLITPSLDSRHAVFGTPPPPGIPKPMKLVDTPRARGHHTAIPGFVSFLRALSWGISAGAIGTLAYLDLLTLYLLALFPVLLVTTRSRALTVFVAWAFFAAPSMMLVPVLEQWAAGTGQPIHHLAFHGYPLLLSLLLATPFLLVDPRARPIKRGIQVGAALVLINLPPLGFLAWINPTMVGAALFPGVGVIAGSLLGILVLSLLAMLPWRRECPSGARLAFGLLLIATLVCHTLNDPRKPPIEPLGWFGVDTRHGPSAPTPEAMQFRAELVAQDARAYLEFPETRLLVFPESVFPNVERSSSSHLAPLRDALSERDAIALVGVTMPRGTHRESFANALVLVSPHGPAEGTILAETRIPVPVGNWRLGGRGVMLNPFASGTVKLDDEVAHITICYEDFLLWASIQNHPATVLVSVANNWMLTPIIAQYQTTAIHAIARLSKKPLIRAVNRLP